MNSAAFSACPLLLLALLCLAESSSGLSCRDEEGRAVDWFIAYKFPKLDGNQLFKDGVAYSYITSDDVDESNEILSSRKADSESKIFLYNFKDLLLKYLGLRAPKSKKDKRAGKAASKRLSEATQQARWKASDKAISDPDSILLQTLAAAFEGSNPKLNSVFYNDDASGTDGAIKESDDDWKKSHNGRRAHAKGVLLMDESTDDGVWLTHSVPRFPAMRGLKLEYPDSGVKNGQTFMCISFDLAQSGKQIVDHLVNMRPLVYDNQISTKMYSIIPDLKNLDTEENIKGRRVRVQPKLAQTITTKGGQVLQLFAKSILFDADIYSGWIDEVIGSDLYVETWRNGNGGPLNSSCPRGDYHINNVQDLKYDDQLKWSYSKDHSKWAISEEKDVGVVCIGDSNRMASQFKRGGGAVCIKCQTCWNIFSSTIHDVEPCPLGQRRPKLKPVDHERTLTVLAKIRKALLL